MQPKPKHLRAEYGNQFSDPSVARAYPTRQPYPDEIFDALERLMPERPRVVLELGCGSGDLTLELARRVDHLDAVDPSAAMLAEARKREGSDAAHLHWHLSSAEDFQITRTYTLACAGASLHWMEWEIVLPKLAAALQPGGLLAIADRDNQCAWDKQLIPLIREHSTNKDFKPYNLAEELSARGLFQVAGELRTAVPFSQTIDDYIESFHSRNGFSRDRMAPESAQAFDAGVRAVVSKYATDGLITGKNVGTLMWGKAIRCS
ncbi:MAG TPA: class I SAM-dependent methyltransferase [Planctomycetota bacterium]|nr:class I SAM-dependent methyltransferase [Planctomycetota bacterium]